MTDMMNEHLFMMGGSVLLVAVWVVFKLKSLSQVRTSVVGRKDDAADLEGGKGVATKLGKEVVDAINHADTGSLLHWIKTTQSIHARDVEGRTALHLACEKGEDVCVQLLLDNSADPLAMDNKLQTPLHLLAMKGHGRLVKMLLDRGSDPMMLDSEGKSAMTLAQESSSIGALRIMKVHKHKMEQGKVLEVNYSAGDQAGLRMRPPV